MTGVVSLGHQKPKSTGAFLSIPPFALAEFSAHPSSWKNAKCTGKGR